MLFARFFISFIKYIEKDKDIHFKELLIQLKILCIYSGISTILVRLYFMHKR